MLGGKTRSGEDCLTLSQTVVVSRAPRPPDLVWSGLAANESLVRSVLGRRRSCPAPPLNKGDGDRMKIKHTMCVLLWPWQTAGTCTSVCDMSSQGSSGSVAPLPSDPPHEEIDACARQAGQAG